MREAGLPLVVSDIQGENYLVLSSKGLVRAVYPETHRVDIETEDGSYLPYALVIGPYMPEIYRDGEVASHVTYLHMQGQAEAICFPETHRRLIGPQDAQALRDQPERRYYHTHGYIFRSGDITIRVTTQGMVVLETEQNDYISLDTQTREVHIHAPTVFVGTDEQHNRIEYEQDDSVRVFQPLVILGTETGDRIEYHDQDHVYVATPQCLIGQTAQPDADGLTYIANSLIHLVSTVIKLTATEAITLDPPRLNFGNANATEHVMLGDSWMALFNAFVTLFNNHVHSNVQAGPGTSGPPTTPTVPMTTAQLSDIAFVSKTGS
ncbi:MAG: hypothetical protein C5B60_02365 [Chloroflexi bacterium]|nr:MAG: hypothetical protein C5B60_02365 [Chloroflexota bacterium]